MMFMHVFEYIRHPFGSVIGIHNLEIRSDVAVGVMARVRWMSNNRLAYFFSFCAVRSNKCDIGMVEFNVVLHLETKRVVDVKKQLLHLDKHFNSQKEM